jgi:hypothetical protein
MKRWHWMIALALLAFTLCGCIPRRLFWSPDGRHAAIIADDGLRLCDAAGKLSDVVAKDIELVAWFPDSRRFLAARKTEAATWEEAATALSPERREALIKLAEPLRKEVLAYSGKWDKFKPKVAAEISDGELAALMLYVREHCSHGLPEKLGATWQDIEKMTVGVYLFQVYDASGVEATAGPVIARALDGINELRVSPDGRVVACVLSIHGGEDPVLRLSVLPADDGVLRTVAEPVAMYPDWTPDGRGLVYGTRRARASDGGDSVQLGSVAQRQVRGESGELLKELAAPQDLVGVVFWSQMKIRCLADGCVLFAAMEVTLPSTSKDMPQRASLFSIDPGRRATVARVVPRESEARLPDGVGVGNFEVSPDGRRVAVSGSEHGNVSVLVLATGEVEAVVTETDCELKSVPAWRTSQELSCFVPPKSKWGSPDRYELVLWAGPEKVRCLSCGWPDIFEKKSPASQPASGPADAGKAGR